MLLTTGIGLFLGFWSLVYLIDLCLRVRNYAFYLRFVERTGFLVSSLPVASQLI